MRLFLAIELPDDAREHLVRVRDHLQSEISKASFTRDQNLHITLKFLGEVESRKLDGLNESLSLIRTGGAIELCASRLECFPERGPVRIVAAGFDGSLGGVKSLHQAIEQRCQRLGFERETREYRPHVTLARARPTLPISVRSITVDFPGPTCVVKEFALIESRLLPQGSEYKALRRFSL